MLATCSAVQCLPKNEDHGQEAIPWDKSGYRLTKVWRLWIGNIVEVPLSIFKILLAKSDPDRHHMVRWCAITLSPLMEIAITLLVKNEVGITGSWSCKADGDGGSYDCEETHFLVSCGRCQEIGRRISLSGVSQHLHIKSLRESFYSGLIAVAYRDCVLHCIRQEDMNVELEELHVRG